MAPAGSVGGIVVRYDESRGQMRDVEVWIDGKKAAEQIAGFSNYTFFKGQLSLKSGKHTASIFGAGVDQSLVHKSVTFSVK